MSAKRVLLVNPLQVNAEDFDLAVARRKGYPAYPPLGLGYLASALRAAGYEPVIYDSYYDGLRSLLEDDADGGAELFFTRFREVMRDQAAVAYVCISVMFAATMKNVARYAALARAAAPQAVIIAGGTHVTCAAESVLATVPEIDYALRFEAEATLPELLRRLDASRALDGISGLARRDSGAVAAAPRTFREENLDRIADPDWSALHMSDYWRIGRFGGAYAIPGCEGQPFACIITSRGCRGHCAFCAVSDVMGGGVRLRSAERVLDEIGALYDRGIRFFEILDDDFTFDRARALAILNGIVQRGYDIRWSAKNGLIACSLDAELIAALHASGCRYVQIGVESGNQQILDWLRKPVSIPRLLEVRELFRAYPDIYLAGYFIVGFPEETEAMMRETYDLALRLELDWSAITMAQPLPGTRMWADMAALGIIDPATVDMSDLTFFHNTAGNKYHTLAEILEWWHDFNIGVNFVNNPNLKSNNLERARRDFEHVARLVAPGQPMALYCLGETHRRLGDVAQARALWTEAQTTVQADPHWQRRFAKFGVDLDLALAQL